MEEDDEGVIHGDARLDEEEYTKQLGLMHQVKEDIDELTASLTAGQWDSDKEKKEKRELFPRGEPRVVLFIDDLDRCPPPRVIEVLEAIQLLVHTKLFVAVVDRVTPLISAVADFSFQLTPSLL